MQLKRRFHAEHMPGEGVVLFSESPPLFVNGALADQAIRLLSSFQDLRVVRQALLGMASAPEVDSLLDHLLTGGFLEDTLENGFDDGESALLSEICFDPIGIKTQLSMQTIDVVNLSSSDATSFFMLAKKHEVKFSPSPDFIFLFCDDYEDPRIRNVNDYCIRTSTPWLLCKPTGATLWIGPFVIPELTGCWECLVSRFKTTREVENFIKRRNGYEMPIVAPSSRKSIHADYAFQVCWSQYVKFVANPKTMGLSGSLVTSTPHSLQQVVHRVVKRPQCGACGTRSLVANSVVDFQLDSGLTAKLVDGGWRSARADETLALYGHHISSISGVVKELVPSMEVGPMHVYIAGHNFALKNDSLYFLQDSMRINSSGKGKSATQAQTSALCEALERYSGVFTGEEPRIKAAFKDLGAEAIHPNSCMLFSDGQYQSRDKWNAKGERFQVVPLKFDEEKEIEWSPVLHFRSKKLHYLPAQYLYYGYPTEDTNFYSWADSNGCAAGTTIEDAIIQATLEVIERDAVAIWWYNKIARPGVDLESINSQFLSDVKQHLSTVGREYWVLDISSDMEVPCYVAATRRLQGSAEDIVFGFGAHLNPISAVERAVSEMIQFLPPVLNQDSQGNTIYQFGDKEILSWWKNAKVSEESYLLPEGSVETPGCDVIGGWAKQGAVCLELVIEELFGRIESKGMEIFLLNQTRPDIGLPVVKVIVPGMRHFWARFAPGRLYTVPIELGWLDKPRSENELNTVAMFV